MRQVDYAYAFGTPHRLTVGLPESSNKTLLDASADMLRIAWTYDDLTRFPLAIFATPATTWAMQVRASVDGAPLAATDWRRKDGWIPALEMTFANAMGQVHLHVGGGASAAVTCIELINTDSEPHNIVLSAAVEGGWGGYNPRWVNAQWEADHLLAGWRERADRVIILGLGADACTAPAPSTLQMSWEVAAGATRRAWLVRPYAAYAEDVPALRTRDWETEYNMAIAAWQTLRAQAARISVPDAGVEQAFYACFADLYIMREPLADGYVGGTPGTEMYRANNPVEVGLVAVALDQLSLHDDAARGYAVSLAQQGADGDWNDPQGWAHHFWSSAGFKSWAVMTHYRTTGDRNYLQQVYPRMLASTRWQEGMRASTRVLEDGVRPFTFGLMPRGMGDAGLMNDDDFYGVYLPHNIWSVYADRLTVEAAEALGRTEDVAELRRIYETALADLRLALDAGAIAEDDYRWIPAVAGKTSGSRWGALNAAFPCEILPVDDPLITGTMRKIESRISPGGIPIHTGWMPDGMWVAITLDNLAETLLWRNEGDAATDYLYATLNHATPLITWCEERGQQPGTPDCAGDRQHLWTPVAVVRYLRDALLMEQGDTLHLARGVARDWLRGPVGIANGGSCFGALSYSLTLDEATQTLRGAITLAPGSIVPTLVVHARLPHGWRVISLSGAPAGTIAKDGETISWPQARGAWEFSAVVG